MTRFCCFCIYVLLTICAGNASVNVISHILNGHKLQHMAKCIASKTCDIPGCVARQLKLTIEKGGTKDNIPGFDNTNIDVDIIDGSTPFPSFQQQTGDKNVGTGEGNEDGTSAANGKRNGKEKETDTEKAGMAAKRGLQGEQEIGDEAELVVRKEGKTHVEVDGGTEEYVRDGAQKEDWTNSDKSKRIEELIARYRQRVKERENGVEGRGGTGKENKTANASKKVEVAYNVPDNEVVVNEEDEISDDVTRSSPKSRNEANVASQDNKFAKADENRRSKAAPYKYSNNTRHWTYSKKPEGDSNEYTSNVASNENIVRKSTPASIFISTSTFLNEDTEQVANMGLQSSQGGVTVVGKDSNALAEVDGGIKTEEDVKNSAQKGEWTDSDKSKRIEELIARYRERMKERENGGEGGAGTVRENKVPNAVGKVEMVAFRAPFAGGRTSNDRETAVNVEIEGEISDDLVRHPLKALNETIVATHGDKYYKSKEKRSSKVSPYKYSNNTRHWTYSKKPGGNSNLYTSNVPSNETIVRNSTPASSTSASTSLNPPGILFSSSVLALSSSSYVVPNRSRGVLPRPNLPPSSYYHFSYHLPKPKHQLFKSLPSRRNPQSKEGIQNYSTTGRPSAMLPLGDRYWRRYDDSQQFTTESNVNSKDVSDGSNVFDDTSINNSEDGNREYYGARHTEDDIKNSDGREDPSSSALKINQVVGEQSNPKEQRGYERRGPTPPPRKERTPALLPQQHFLEHARETMEVNEEERGEWRNGAAEPAGEISHQKEGRDFGNSLRENRREVKVGPVGSSRKYFGSEEGIIGGSTTSKGGDGSVRKWEQRSRSSSPEIGSLEIEDGEDSIKKGVVREHPIPARSYDGDRAIAMEEQKGVEDRMPSKLDEYEEQEDEKTSANQAAGGDEEGINGGSGWVSTKPVSTTGEKKGEDALENLHQKEGKNNSGDDKIDLVDSNVVGNERSEASKDVNSDNGQQEKKDDKVCVDSSFRPSELSSILTTLHLTHYGCLAILKDSLCDEGDNKSDKAVQEILPSNSVIPSSGLSPCRLCHVNTSPSDVKICVPRGESCSRLKAAVALYKITTDIESEGGRIEGGKVVGVLLMMNLVFLLMCS